MSITDIPKHINSVNIYIWSVVLATAFALIIPDRTFGLFVGAYIFVLAMISFTITIAGKKKIDKLTLFAEFLASGALMIILLDNYFVVSVLINNQAIIISNNAFMVIEKCIQVYCGAIGVLLIADWCNVAMTASPPSR